MQNAMHKYLAEAGYPIKDVQELHHMCAKQPTRAAAPASSPTTPATVCGEWCVVCSVQCVVCGVWCVVCGVWCV
jgi:hypothetical protein